MSERSITSNFVPYPLPRRIPGAKDDRRQSYAFNTPPTPSAGLTYWPGACSLACSSRPPRSTTSTCSADRPLRVNLNLFNYVLRARTSTDPGRESKNRLAVLGAASTASPCTAWTTSTAVLFPAETNPRRRRPAKAGNTASVPTGVSGRRPPRCQRVSRSASRHITVRGVSEPMLNSRARWGVLLRAIAPIKTGVRGGAPRRGRRQAVTLHGHANLRRRITYPHTRRAKFTLRRRVT